MIYFEVNNWFCGRDYPDTKTFRKWLGDDFNQKFRDREWVEENGLIVIFSIVDMSMNYCVEAPEDWVKENCPEILGSKFIREPDYDGYVEGRFGCPFVEYNEENIGLYFARELEDNYGGTYYRLEKERS